MFDMFRGGKPDPITLMAVTYEERQVALKKLATKIKRKVKNNQQFDSDWLNKAIESVGLDELTYSECDQLSQMTNIRITRY